MEWRNPGEGGTHRDPENDEQVPVDGGGGKVANSGFGYGQPCHKRDRRERGKEMGREKNEKTRKELEKRREAHCTNKAE